MLLVSPRGAWPQHGHLPPPSLQGWLQLGSKQRATAATGMNDKSSRSHSVLTLVMTCTQVRAPTRNRLLRPCGAQDGVPANGGTWPGLVFKPFVREAAYLSVAFP